MDEVCFRMEAIYCCADNKNLRRPERAGRRDNMLLSTGEN